MNMSTQWWSETKADASKINAWLVKQYVGEITAAMRIRNVTEQYKDGLGRSYAVLQKIISDEERHAGWVGELLTARGIELPVVNKEEAEQRYWAEVLPTIESFEDAAAVGAHAEEMRLHRIMAIAEDADAPADIRDVFQRILPDEQFHAKAFAAMSSQEALIKNEGNHRRGLEVLGLEP